MHKCKDLLFIPDLAVILSNMLQMVYRDLFSQFLNHFSKVLNIFRQGKHILKPKAL